MPKKKSAGTDSDTLEQFRKMGVIDPLLLARLDFSTPGTVLKQYIRPIIASGKDRIYPHSLPTQASGRWSTTKPPLVNFPPDCMATNCEYGRKKRERGENDEHMPMGLDCYSCRDIPEPDEGWAYISWDLDAVEARLIAAYSDDKLDLEAFANGWDIHTLTACNMFGLPLPPDRSNPHTSLEGVEWRALVGWEGKDDRRRHLAKTNRYGLAYGEDHMAILNAKDIEKLGLTRDEILKFARMYLASKPNLQAAKKKAWEEVARTGEARTFLGMRRKLFMSRADYARWFQKGKSCEQQRQGWNHKIQGAVAGIMNLTLIAYCNDTDRIFLVNKHDGADVAVPEEQVDEALAEAKALVNKTWVIEGREVAIKGDFKIVYPDGRKEKVK